jgi:hypothetical protein
MVDITAKVPKGPAKAFGTICGQQHGSNIDNQDACGLRLTGAHVCLLHKRVLKNHHN